jgi:catechol 2,3-dioxygenase-like lactoylglutathione lyase family enzyme
MRPIPIRYVKDMDAAQRFYEALGLTVEFTSRAPRQGPAKWVELHGGAGMLALHHIDDDEPGIELAFEAQEPLEDVVARLAATGYHPATAIVDEAFGRSFTVRDPEGQLLQINEHDRELHG